MKMISPIKERALRQLARYKYLTVSQSVKLKVGITKRVREAYAELALQGYTKFVKYEKIHPNIGKLENVHFLTPLGVKLLCEHIKEIPSDSIRFPKGTVTLKNDYFHRISAINTHISIDKWALDNDIEVIKYQTYFDKVGNQRRVQIEPLKSIVRIDFENGHYLDPDAIAIVSKKNRTYIYIIETYNGNDSKRVIQQLRKINYVILHGLTASKYNVNAPTKVICTFEFEANMQAVIKKLMKDPYFQFNGIENYYFFGLASLIAENFENSLINLNGETVKLFDS